MKKFLLAILLSCALESAFSQQAAKDVFFELGGPGLASINYDMRFTKREDGIGGRIGVGGFSFSDGYDRSSTLLIPVGLNYLLGKDRRHYFEVGAGVTIVRASNTLVDSNDDDVFTGTFGHLNFGYRLQPADGGFFFRASINPVFARGIFIPYYGGVSFGYKFGSGKKSR